MFALTLFFVFLPLTVLGAIVLRILGRIEEKPFVGRSHMDHMVICSVLHYRIEKWWRPLYVWGAEIIKGGRGSSIKMYYVWTKKAWVRTSNCMWLVNTEDMKSWTFQLLGKNQVVTYIHDRATTGYTRQVPVHIRLVKDIFVPTERSAIDPKTEQIMFGTEPFNADSWVRNENRKLARLFRYCLIFTLISGAVASIFGGILAGPALADAMDTSDEPINVTITVPGKDKVIIKDTTVGEARERLMIDGIFLNYVYQGKVFKIEEADGGFTAVCLGQKISQACGLGVGKFEMGQVIYLRDSEVAFQGDMSGYSRNLVRRVITEQQANALIKSGRFTLIKR
jgi:hypothetical protein